MNGLIVHRANYPLIAAVIAEKLRLKTARIDFPNPVRPAAAERARKAG